MSARVLALALFALAFASASAAPANASDATHAVERYLDALHAGDYPAAYAMLTPQERAYFRDARNFASGFTVDRYALQSYRIRATRNAGDASVIFVDERVAVREPSRDASVLTDVTVPYVVRGAGPRARIGDTGRPWRADAIDASGAAAGVRVTVKRLAYFARAVRVVVQLENTAAGFVTILPYGRSVLRDGDHLYHPLETRDPQWTDRQFLLGVRLAPRTRYTGAIAFVTPLLGDRPRAFALTIGPAVRDGASAPASIDVAIAAARS